MIKVISINGCGSKIIEIRNFGSEGSMIAEGLLDFEEDGQGFGSESPATVGVQST